MRQIANMNDEFMDCVAYFRFNVANSTHGFTFALEGARARPLVDGRRPALIPQADRALPPADPKRNIRSVIESSALEDITRLVTSTVDPTSINLPALGSADQLPVFIELNLAEGVFLVDNSTSNWAPIKEDDQGFTDTRFISYFISNHQRPNDLAILRYNNHRGAAIGHFDLSATVPPGAHRTKPSGSTIHNSPP